MGKKHKKHHKDAKEDGDDIQVEKAAGLKLVLKVGAPLTPSDFAADSQSETFDSDTAMSEKKLKLRKRILLSDKSEHEDKKRRQDDEDDDEDSEDGDEDYGEEKDQVQSQDTAETEDDVRVRSLREKRNADDDRSALFCCLDYLQKILQRKDTNGFFAFPVTDNIAPGYSSIISHPMDFSTMRARIDAGEYHSVAEYRADYQLMMENCMQYNHQETVYHREAKRLLSVGLKHMSRDRLLQMKRNLPAMSTLTTEEIGIDDESSEGASSSADVRSKSAKERSSSQRKQGFSRFEAIPDKMTPDEILRQAQNAARGAADRLALRAPNSKFGFLRRRDDGSTTLNILNPDTSGIVSDKERVVTLGELIGKLTHGSGTLIGLKEDRRNKANPVNYLSYGAFSSYGPVYDSSTSNLSKEDSDLLLSTYGDETGLQYAKSLQQFVADAGQYSVRMVDNLLDILTSGEHSKASASIIQKESDRLRQEQEEAKKRLETETSNKLADSQRGVNPAETESQRRLDNLAAMLFELQRLQNVRLGSRLPEQLADVPNASDEEKELGLKISNELTQMVKQVLPCDVVSVQTLRSAMGVTCEPVQSCAVEKTVETAASASWSACNVQSDSSSKQSELDEDVNEFFGSGTSTSITMGPAGVGIDT